MGYKLCLSRTSPPPQHFPWGPATRLLGKPSWGGEAGGTPNFPLQAGFCQEESAFFREVFLSTLIWFPGLQPIKQKTDCKTCQRKDGTDGCTLSFPAPGTECSPACARWCLQPGGQSATVTSVAESVLCVAGVGHSCVPILHWCPRLLREAAARLSRERRNECSAPQPAEGSANAAIVMAEQRLKGSNFNSRQLSDKERIRA